MGLSTRSTVGEFRLVLPMFVLVLVQVVGCVLFLVEILLPELLLQHAETERDSSHIQGVLPMLEWNKCLCGTEISQLHLEKVSSCWKVARLL